MSDFVSVGLNFGRHHKGILNVFVYVFLLKYVPSFSLLLKIHAIVSVFILYSKLTKVFRHSFMF